MYLSQVVTIALAKRNLRFSKPGPYEENVQKFFSDAHNITRNTTATQALVGRKTTSF